MHDREPDEVGEIETEGQLGDRQTRFDRPIFAAAPGLRPALNSVFGRARETRLVIEDRFQHGAGVVERKTDAERKQTWKKQHLFHPAPRMELALCANVKHRHRN